MRTGARAASAAMGAALLTGALTALPAASAAPPPTRVWRVARVRADRALPLDLRAVVTPRGRQWTALVVAVRVTGGRRTATPAALALPAQEPVVYDGGSATRPCAPCEGADGPQEVGVQRASTSEEFLLAVRDGAATVAVSPGWRVREVAPTVLRVATVDSGTATGAASPVAAVERFTAASLPGGRHGSFAWLVLPCGTAGVGVATLTPSPRRAGDGTGEASCTERRAGAWAMTPGGATWRAQGDAVGTGSGPSLLVVLDLPRA